MLSYKLMIVLQKHVIESYKGHIYSVTYRQIFSSLYYDFLATKSMFLFQIYISHLVTRVGRRILLTVPATGVTEALTA